jgi:hypothetical protein
VGQVAARVPDVLGTGTWLLNAGQAVQRSARWGTA